MLFTYENHSTLSDHHSESGGAVITMQNNPPVHICLTQCAILDKLYFVMRTLISIQTTATEQTQM